MDLSYTANNLSNATGRPVTVFLGAAFFYLCLALPSGWALGWLERKAGAVDAAIAQEVLEP